MFNESTFALAQCEQPADERGCPDPTPHARHPRVPAATAAMAARLVDELPYLRRLGRRWHRGSADADDLVQDTIARALNGACSWEAGSNLRAWLATIMRNQFLAARARTRRAKLAAELIAVEMHWSGVADSEVQLTLRDVERAVRRLPAKQRSAVLLAGIHGKSYSEIAEVMGVTADAVRCHLARARDRLRSAVYRHDEKNWLQHPRPRRSSPRKASQPA